MNKIWKRVFMIGTISILVILIVLLAINFFVVGSTKSKVILEEEASKLENVDCIIVLGAGIWQNKPSPRLEYRLLQEIA